MDVGAGGRSPSRVDGLDGLDDAGRRIDQRELSWSPREPPRTSSDSSTAPVLACLRSRRAPGSSSREPCPGLGTGTDGRHTSNGKVLELLAAGRRVVGVDLQSHGRSPATERPMRFETMADDIGALIRELGLERAAIMGFSLGGAVGLRTAIQHPEVVERLVLVSTVFKRTGWHPEMTAGMDAMGPETAEVLMQTPLYEAYRRVAPRLEDWPVLVRQVAEVTKVGYDWSSEVPGLSAPVMLVIADADGMPPSHAVEFFGLLGGGRRDAGWDRSGMTPHRLAILPGATHYDINMQPALSAAAIPFLGGG